MLWIAACLIFYFLGLLTKAAETSFTLAPVTGLVLGVFPFTNTNSFIDQIIPLADTHFVGGSLPSRCLERFIFAARAGSKCRQSIHQSKNTSTPLKELTSPCQDCTTAYLQLHEICKILSIVQLTWKVYNETEAKMCFHLSVLIVTCYRWPDVKVGWAVTNFFVSETILDRLSLIYINLHATKARTFQQCKLCYVEYLISSDFLVNNLTQTSFFRC